MRLPFHHPEPPTEQLPPSPPLAWSPSPSALPEMRYREADDQGRVGPERSLKPPRKQRVTISTYDRVTKTAGLVVGLVIAVGMWWLGAYFTLRWLASLGLALASAGALAYLIPLAITAAEIGLWPRRVSSAWSRSFWFAVLAFDVGTTAAGVVDYTQGFLLLGRSITGPLAWGLGCATGVLLALAPERAGRSLWRELRETV